ncbi:MAG TPA: hypothetical protein ENF30_01745 [Candidatus Desulfofervidus auxilii]|uniref:Uncharacterized protein n=1 Tax=Desulfofervidus auxilii TaxID=1621989 RepID=A0A7V0IA27_DESA2|nr:hypothetical protein [Candidatus Desulfofervidus auxilii]
MNHKKIFVLIGMFLFFALGAATMMVFLKNEKSSDIVEKVIKEPLRFTKIQKTPKKVENKPIQTTKELAIDQKRKKGILTKGPKPNDNVKLVKDKRQSLEKSLAQILTAEPAKSKEKKKQIEQKNTRIITPEQIRQLYEKRMEALKYLQ